jgi:hypothetical protein
MGSPSSSNKVLMIAVVQNTPSLAAGSEGGYELGQILAKYQYVI